MTNKRTFLLILIFGLSGFAGLIYQSIWANYFKLFLGHSAYSQSLVLAIFMGGMAIGSWLISRRIESIKRPVLWYAGIEAIIGIFGLVFHQTYEMTTGFINAALIPHLDSHSAIDLVKWSASALIILPQSILLGATFPVLSSGLIRFLPTERGRLISLLYFSNSLGAVFGVLTSGFVLISAYGLPGTVITAGAINLWLAALVWVLNSRWQIDAAPVFSPDSRKGLVADASMDGAGLRLLMVVAGLTGLASFFYELGWIRMLTMVLGSSTHSFELMLSGFILGIAIGGFVIKGKIDGLKSPVVTLAMIQLTMGALAALSLFVYDKTFVLMSVLVNGLSNSDSGYLFFNLSSHLIVLLLMLPTTICAGMTLPLITACLMRTPLGEKGIGWVYAANTLGSIIGVVLVIHWILPTLGLKAVILLGAAVDVALGIALLRRSNQRNPVVAYKAPVFAASLAIVSAAFLFHIDAQKTASGVYRNGSYRIDAETVARLDGKTASIDVFRMGEGEEEKLVIATNGKPDASIAMSNGSATTPDEITMVLAAVLPLAMHDAPARVANIGIGSGLTGHAMLGDPRVKQLDSIEIEPKMAEGARSFGDKVARTFDDPRSVIHFQDAKTFFTYEKQDYDVIISEPSNPWVSGVATLFSTEFYQHVVKYLAKDGVFVQWLHLYETDMETVASVLKALGSHFNHYVIYSSNTVDMLIVASQSGESLSIKHDLFKSYSDPELLARVGFSDLDDIRFHFMASKRVLAPFFEGVAVAPHSDFYPVIDNRAARARFLESNFVELSGLYKTPFSLEDLWPGNEPERDNTRHVLFSGSEHFEPNQQAQIARQLYAFFASKAEMSADMPEAVYASSAIVLGERCMSDAVDDHFMAKSLIKSYEYIFPYWSPAQQEELFTSAKFLGCARAQGATAQLIELGRLLYEKRFNDMVVTIGNLKETPETRFLFRNTATSVFLDTLLLYAMTASGQYEEAIALFEGMEKEAVEMTEFPYAISLPIMYRFAQQEAAGRVSLATIP